MSARDRQPEAPPQIAELLVALRGNGMSDAECSDCGRWYLTRTDDPLCPPCRTNRDFRRLAWQWFDRALELEAELALERAASPLDWKAEARRLVALDRERKR